MTATLAVEAAGLVHLVLGDETPQKRGHHLHAGFTAQVRLLPDIRDVENVPRPGDRIHDHLADLVEAECDRPALHVRAAQSPLGARRRAHQSPPPVAIDDVAGRTTTGRRTT